MNFISTRGEGKLEKASRAIINGIANDGGLYVPESFPRLYDELKNKLDMSYEEIAFEVMKLFFDDISARDLKEAIDDAYKGRFEVKEENGFLELFHGPTSAFKDAALLFLPQIMKKAKVKCNIDKEIVILTATSGDTGKAALQGFSNVKGFKVVVYYPKAGVSAIQERQMITQVGDNVKVIGIRGNFDNAQSGVKNIFNDNELKEKLSQDKVLLSSANSINIGRLVPQIVYYFYGYFNLVKKNKIKNGHEINVVVPTGNFGNILAAYYAKRMGLPIDKLICASNENNVLTDFFNTGIYDKRRELRLTESPSMDILVSSNLERLLFESVNRDGNVISNLMKALEEDGLYELPDSSKNFFKSFYGDFANTDEVYKAIKKVFNENSYLIDTHTAVGYVVLNKYRAKTGDYKPYLLASTASPYKFPRSIAKALGLDLAGKDDFDVLEALRQFTGKEVPDNLINLDKHKILHDSVYDKEDMEKALLDFLNGESNG